MRSAWISQSMGASLHRKASNEFLDFWEIHHARLSHLRTGGAQPAHEQTQRTPTDRMSIWHWTVATLRNYPELALFLALAIGFAIGPRKLAGFSLGNVTSTLLAALAIGQLGIEVPGPLKSTFFLLFLFAVGYGVGPQFFAGLSR